MSANAIISLSSGAQARRAEEEREGTGDVETGQLAAGTKRAAGAERGQSRAAEWMQSPKGLRGSECVLRGVPSASQHSAPLVLDTPERRPDGQLSRRLRGT